MLNRYKQAAVIIGLTTATAFTGLAYAQERPLAAIGTLLAQASQTAKTNPQENWLNLRQVYDKLVEAGYIDIREIERERNGYEAKARDPEGRSVKLEIEPVQGRIVDEKARDRDRGNRG